MGFNRNGVNAILLAKAHGVSFRRVAMVGRQELHISPESLRENLCKHGFDLSLLESERLIQDHNGFAEGFLKFLGAEEIYSFDAADFEGATHVHDFNLPIDKKWCNLFDCVVDAGSLEHIFNFPIAIQNCTSMVRLGGHLISIAPANNLFGHGFYQFSPELFFRVLSRKNGYATRIFLFQDHVAARWLEVRDPAEMRVRGTLVNFYPTYLFVLARKDSQCVKFESPQQSDYEAQWEGSLERSKPDWTSRLVALLGHTWAWRMLGWLLDHLTWGLLNRHTKNMFAAHRTDDLDRVKQNP